MSWVKLDDRFPLNPKVLPLSDKAFRSYITALCYAAQHLTDGYLPPGVIPGRSAAALVEAGLLTRGTAGWMIHDYLKYNPSRDEVESRSESARHASRMRWADDSETERTRGRGRGKDKKEHPRFGEFYDVYPRHVGRIAASASFDKAVERAEPDVIIAAAQAYRDDPSRKADYTAHPATWLNQGRWMDERAVSGPVVVPDPARIVGTPEYETAKRSEEDAAIAAFEIPEDELRSIVEGIGGEA